MSETEVGTITATLDTIIGNLQAVRDDALKCDKGRAGAAGKRVRAAAQDGRKALYDLRKLVVDARKATKSE